MLSFNIPNYSRSIIVPDGWLFLLGGEDRIVGVWNQIYSYSLVNKKPKIQLTQMSNMPFEKMDF